MVIKSVCCRCLIASINHFAESIFCRIKRIASLSFLGVGIQPPTADWGSMVRDTGELIQFAAYDVTAALTPILPAAAIGILTVDWFLYLTSGLKDEHE